MSSITTKSGKAIKPIGIGTWGIGGTWQKEVGNEQESIELIKYAISRGQNHIDSGQIYGGGYTDEIIGEAINDLRREDLLLSDKLWETNVENGKAEIAVDEMLKKIRTDYLDILYIHKPWENYPWRDAIPQINDLIDKNKVRYFAVSNFNLEQLKEAVKLSRHRIVANQLHYNILNKTEINQEMFNFCSNNDIRIIAYKPLERTGVLDNKTLLRISKKYKSTPAQIAIAWILKKGMWTIPGLSSNEFIEDNLKSININLSQNDVEILDNL